MTAEAAAVTQELPDAHVPDVLETLAQLPNDDVYTPPKVVTAMLEILPAHVWTEPNYTWLDPATKSGVYLREIFKRLMVGLAEWEPDGKKRREHILKNMLFGAATTQINGEVARRSIYQTKNATGDEVKDDSLRDLVVRFDQPAGNVPFVEAEHTFRGEGINRRCTWCGAPEALVREGREQYAYSFVHDLYPTAELENMKFDVIVGNPPYQIGVEGNTRTRPLYQLFVERAIALDPRYIVMITPSRWFTGGLGLDEYRDRMINDRRLRVIVDNPKIFDVFPQAKIRGGVSYFLWDREYAGDCDFSTRIDGRIISTARRDIREGHGVLIRDNTASALVHQVLERTERSVEELFYPRLAFSQEWRTNFQGDSEQPFAGGIPIIHNGGVGYVREQSLSPATYPHRRERRSMRSPRYQATKICLSPIRQSLAPLQIVGAPAEGDARCAGIAEFDSRLVAPVVLLRKGDSRDPASRIRYAAANSRFTGARIRAHAALPSNLSSPRVTSAGESFSQGDAIS